MKAIVLTKCSSIGSQTLLFLLSLICCSVASANAGEPLNINQWGPETNHIRMLIEPKDGRGEIKTNEPFTLVYSIQNLSTNSAYYIIHSADPRQNCFFSFVIEAPSGQRSELSLNPGGRMNQVANINVHPRETTHLDFKLNDVFAPKEVGVYKITAIIEIFPMTGTNVVKTVSNSLLLTVVPGSWTPRPIPPAKFQVPLIPSQ